MIDTDYETYALVYGCTYFDQEGKWENAYVMTRDALDTPAKYPDETYYKEMFEKNIPTFNYTYAFANNYGIQGMKNGCDGPQGSMSMNGISMNGVMKMTPDNTTWTNFTVSGDNYHLKQSQGQNENGFYYMEMIEKFD